MIRYLIFHAGKKQATALEKIARLPVEINTETLLLVDEKLSLIKVPGRQLAMIIDKADLRPKAVLRPEAVSTVRCTATTRLHHCMRLQL